MASRHFETSFSRMSKRGVKAVQPRHTRIHRILRETSVDKVFSCLNVILIDARFDDVRNLFHSVNNSKSINLTVSCLSSAVHWRTMSGNWVVGTSVLIYSLIISLFLHLYKYLPRALNFARGLHQSSLWRGNKFYFENGVRSILTDYDSLSNGDWGRKHSFTPDSSLIFVKSF